MWGGCVPECVCRKVILTLRTAGNKITFYKSKHDVCLTVWCFSYSRMAVWYSFNQLLL